MSKSVGVIAVSSEQHPELYGRVYVYILFFGLLKEMLAWHLCASKLFDAGTFYIKKCNLINHS